MSHLNIAMTDEREDTLRRLMQATGENTKSGAVDVAMRHYLRDKANKEDCIERMPAELVDDLSTQYLTLERTVENRVYRE